MFEVFSEVRATLSVDFLDAIGGLARLEAIRAAFTAPTSIEHVAGTNVVQLYGTLDGILCAKSTLEEAHKEMLLKRLSDEAKELDSTTFSEENSSQADEGNTSYDKEEGTDKASCLSDDKEQDTLGPQIPEGRPPRESRCMRLLPKRVRVLDHRVRQQLLRKKKPLLPPDHPDYLSENLRQMKLAGGTTAAEDSDSAGTEEQRLRRPCRARNFEACYPIKRKRRVLNCPHCSYKTSKLHYYERHQRMHSHKAHHRGKDHHHKEPSTSGGSLSSPVVPSSAPTWPPEEKPQCPKCKMCLSSRSRLGPMQCDFCSIMSRSKAFLKRHAQYLHARYSCNKCNKKFNSRNTLRHHQNLHNNHYRRPKVPHPSPELPGPSYLPLRQALVSSPSTSEILHPPTFVAPSSSTLNSLNEIHQSPSQLLP